MNMLTDTNSSRTAEKDQTPLFGGYRGSCGNARGHGERRTARKKRAVSEVVGTIALIGVVVVGMVIVNVVIFS